MRGSVIKKGDRWYVKIELDPDPATGKRRQKWHSGYNTKREAERARIDLLSKFDRGEYVEPTQQTVAEYLAEWLRAIEPTVRPSTFESYSRNMRNHVVAHIGAVRLTKVDAGLLNGLYAQLLATGRRPSSRLGAGYSPEVVALANKLRSRGMTLQETADYLRFEFAEAEHITKDTLASLLRRSAAEPAPKRGTGLDRRTVSYTHTILHRAFKDAVRWGRLARNPVDAADSPKAGHKTDDMRTWDAETLRSFIEQSRAADDRLHGLWVLLATTGMRRGEALGLR
jgi:integrase